MPYRFGKIFGKYLILEVFSFADYKGTWIGKLFKLNRMYRKLLSENIVLIFNTFIEKE